MPYNPNNNPYMPGDLYSYDLKWVVSEIDKWKISEDSAEQAAASAQEASESAAEAKASALNASNSADSAERSEAAAADYAANIADPVSGIVTDWLAANITQPTTPAIDASLSVAGAAADAAAVGKQLEFNATNTYEAISGAFIPASTTTTTGITTTPNSDGSFTLSGTATAITQACNFYIKPTLLPTFFQPGQTYTFTLESTDPGNYDLRVYSYVSGGSSSMLAQIPPNTPVVITTPLTMIGASMILRVPANVAVNGTVRLIINEGTLTNQLLTRRAQPMTADLSLFKSIGVCGDSFAAGWFYKIIGGAMTRVENPDHSWPMILGRKHGCEIGHFCYGGLDTITYQTDTQHGLPSVLSNDPCEAYILALGINDVPHRGISGLGTIADITNDYTQNPHTFFGDYARIIEQIMAHAPNAKLIMLTMAHTSGNYPAFNTAIEEIAAHYGIGLMRELDHPFFASKPLFENRWVNGHPSSIQASGMADAINELFTNACNNNYSYFSDLC